MSENVITEPWPDEFIRTAKRTNLRRDGFTNDWFVGYGKDRGCQFEGKWYHLMMFAAEILASENTKLVVEACPDVPDELYHPELEEVVYLHAQHTGAPYSISIEDDEE